MKKILFLSVIVVLAFSCKKEDELIEEIESSAPVEVGDYMPMAIGNYWVYEHFKIDSNGVETKIGMVDSVQITGTESLRGNQYFVFEGTSKPYNNFKGNVVAMLRDSSGYLVNQSGAILMTVLNFGDTITKHIEEKDSSWIYKTFGIMERETSVVIPGIGPDRVINYAGYFIHNKAYLPTAIATSKKINSYYSKNVGLVMHDYFYSTDYFNTKSYIEKRLVRYHVELEL